MGECYDEDREQKRLRSLVQNIHRNAKKPLTVQEEEEVRAFMDRVEHRAEHRVEHKRAVPVYLIIVIVLALFAWLYYVL